MPELAEVYYYSKQWDSEIGRTIVAVHTHAKCRVFRGCDVAALEAHLSGARLVRAHAHGKQMLMEFSKGAWLTIHLGMTGELSAKPLPFEGASHDHLVLETRRRALVFSDHRQFGSVRFHHGKSPPEEWQKLPPPPMDSAFTAAKLAKILQRHGKVVLKALLLDQRYFPGVGNWMADEILWQMRLPPQLLSGALNQLQIRRLHRTLRKVCSVALKTVGVDWSDPPRTWLFRYRWTKGLACPRCGASLTRAELRGRTACWCPVCQKA